jgi:hypothetical protein
MIEPKTYKNRPISPNPSTTLHERSEDRTSQPSRFKLEIPMIENEAPPKISLASISCTQQNRNEDMTRK